jgi:hypothetical protein
MNPEPVDEQQPAASENTLLRLGAIENHLDQIDARLATISEFNGRLDEIHTILETVIGFVTPDRIIESLTEPSTRTDDDPSSSGYRVVAHVSRDNGGTRLVPDVSWPDAWSVRLFVTALMRNLTRNNPVDQRRRCWCEVWTPDETGEFVDSAILNPDTGAIEWESDILRRTEPS